MNPKDELGRTGEQVAVEYLERAGLRILDRNWRSANGEVFFEVTMQDAWVWDMYRPARFVKNVRVVTFKDVNIEELAQSDFELPDSK